MDSLDRWRVRVSVVNLTAAQIVGAGAGQLGNGAGVTLVATPGAGRVIMPITTIVNFTFAVAAYTGGGNVTTSIAGSTVGAAVIAANSFGSVANIVDIFVMNASIIGSTLTAALVMKAAAAFTQPGTAAGTARVTTYYRILDL